MPRRKEKAASGGVPPWMVTYSDLMTLLLTLFVLLTSMAQLDERRVRDFLIYTRGDAAFGSGMFNPLSIEDQKSSVEPGPITPDTDELEFIRRMIWEDKNMDLNLETNRYVAIISIAEAALFAPGSSTLSPEGRRLLDGIAPQLQNMGYPVLVAGHTSTLREESEGGFYESRQNIEASHINLTWKLSMMRALAVYGHFKSKNLSGLNIMNEGFGEYRPKISNNTPQGRKTNRRVDIVLDRRNQKELARLEAPATPEENNMYEIDKFRFQLDVPQHNEFSNGSDPLMPLTPPESTENQPTGNPLNDASTLQTTPPGQNSQPQPIPVMPQAYPENGENKP